MSAELCVLATLQEGPHQADLGSLVLSTLAGRFPNADVVSLPGAAVATTCDHAAATSSGDDHTITSMVAVTREALDRAIGHRFPASLGLDGGHVMVTARPMAGTVQVTNDGLGSVPFYWTIRDGFFVGATKLGLLVKPGVPVEWDEVALAQYLALLHPLGNRTLLHGVLCLPAGARLTAAPTGIELSSDPLFSPQDAAAASDGDAVGRFAAAWQNTMTDVLDRTERERLGVALSGGLDSRAVISGLAGQGARPLTFTYGGPRQREARVGRAIAHRLGLPHLELPVGDAELRAELLPIASELDGVHCPAEFYDCWFLPRLRQSVDVMVSGLWGGPLWGGDKGFGLTTPDSVAGAYLGRVIGSLHKAAAFLAGWSATDVGEAVREDALAGLSRWQPRDDLSVFWNVDNRQRRWGLAVPTAMARSGMRVEAPFLAGEVVAALAALTPDQRRYGRLHLLAHRRLFSDLSDIPRGNDGNAPDALSHVYWSGDRTIASQLWELARSHPVSATRRLGTQGRSRLVAKLPARSLRTRLSDRIAAADEVFPAELLARTSPAYRARLADYLEQAVAHVPQPLSAASLASAADELRRPAALTFDPLVAARAATIGTWARLWSARGPATVARPLRQHFDGNEPGAPRAAPT